MGRRLTIKRRVARWAWRHTRRKAGDVRRWWRTAGGSEGGPTPYGHASRTRPQTSTRNNTGGERPSGHYSRPRPAGKVQPMGTRLSTRATALLPPECRRITDGAQGVGAWKPDIDTPATDAQLQLGALGLTLSQLESGLSDFLDTLVAMGVHRRITNAVGGAVDNVTAAAEGFAATARKFAEMYGSQMAQEQEPVKPVMAPGARRAA